MERANLRCLSYDSATSRYIIHKPKTLSLSFPNLVMAQAYLKQVRLLVNDCPTGRKEQRCECCNSLIVWQTDGIWSCWYCDTKNVTPWKCGCQQGRHAAQISSNPWWWPPVELSTVPETSPPVLAGELSTVPETSPPVLAGELSIVSKTVPRCTSLPVFAGPVCAGPVCAGEGRVEPPLTMGQLLRV